MDYHTFFKIFDSMNIYFIATDLKGRIKKANNLFLYKFEKVVLDITNISYIDLNIYDLLNDNKRKKIEISLFNSTHIVDKFTTYENCYFLIRKKDSSQTNKIYEKVINSINERIVASDKEGRVLLFNKASEKFEKINKDHVLGRKITDLYDITEETSLLMNVIRTEKPLLNIHQISTNNIGKKIDDMVDTWPIYDNDELFGAVSIMKDYSKIDELTKQVIDLQSKLIKPKDSSIDNSPLSARYSFSDIVSSSDNMAEVISIAKRAAKSVSPVLIYGETGTGKELFAQSIHDYSQNRTGPFIAINCAAIPDNLLEGLLFGTVKGAFSDAIDRPGLFEQAEGGTILLDELNSMSLNLQSKLLRVLQENKVRRVGSPVETNINTRVITIINEDPIKAVRENRIRLDLFYRISVIMLEVPPLRSRKEDIPLLSELFIIKYNNALGKQVSGLSNISLQAFSDYNWPGNVRELQHALEYAMNIIPSSERFIEIKHLPQHIVENVQIDKVDESEHMSLEKRLNIEEVKILKKELNENNWRIADTARKLGLKRQSLQYRIKKYSLKKEGISD